MTVKSYTKHGLRKILKNEYELNTSRFELRENFPDLPNCPFGNQHLVMGFDKEEKEYVWLVKSILRDSRLKVVSYN